MTEEDGWKPQKQYSSQILHRCCREYEEPLFVIWSDFDGYGCVVLDNSPVKKKHILNCTYAKEYDTALLVYLTTLLLLSYQHIAVWYLFAVFVKAEDHFNCLRRPSQLEFRVAELITSLLNGFVQVNIIAWDIIPKPTVHRNIIITLVNTLLVLTSVRQTFFVGSHWFPPKTPGISPPLFVKAFAV